MVALATELLLLIPLIAMGFSEEVFWTGSDFAVAWILLFGAGTAYVLATRKTVGNRRLIIGAIIAAIFLLLWAELAVGVFGSPIAGS